MNETVTYDELKNLNTNSYRRVIIFSKNKMYLFPSGVFYNYVQLEKMENIIQSYIECVENTEEYTKEYTKKYLPYLFIFNKGIEIPENKLFFECSNWLIVE